MVRCWVLPRTTTRNPAANTTVTWTPDAHSLYERYGLRPLADAIRFMEVFRPTVYQSDSPPNTPE